MMGRRLLPYAENGEHQLLLGNRRENRGFSVEKLRSVIPGGHVYGVACSHVYSVGRTIWLKSTYAGILFLWRKRFFTRLKDVYKRQMEDWAKRLDGFLEFNGNELLMGPGKVSAEQAKLHAETEFEKYRIVQDRLFMSDYDKYLLELEDQMGKEDL